MQYVIAKCYILCFLLHLQTSNLLKCGEARVAFHSTTSEGGKQWKTRLNRGQICLVFGGKCDKLQRKMWNIINV